MYKVFIKESLIYVTSDKTPFKDHNIFKLKKVDLAPLIEQIEKGEIDNVVLYSKNEDKLLKRLHKKLPHVVAGGGLVINKNNEFLFIHRNGKWDLPKGKAEKGETIEETAVREIEEETGVKKLKIQSHLGRTYHIFHRKGKLQLKQTEWFVMQTKFKGSLKPQEKEGIDKAVWIDREKAGKIIKKSYRNIRNLVPEDAFDRFRYES
ncbi:MAG: NUDIX domain-containing protein [Nonlabens sp.]